MALIGCPECGREVSSSAAACPDCAYPLVTGITPIPHHPVKVRRKRDWVIPGLSILSRLVVGMILFGVGADEGSGTAMTGGLIVGGSAIPTFFRAWRIRLKSTRPDTALPDGLADRILDMEHMHREQISDLEERIEFTERMLSKQRDQIGPG